MPKFPDASSLGGLPGGGDRRVPTYDVSGAQRGAEQLGASLKEGGRALASAIDQGGQAIAKGLETFGKGVSNLGEGGLSLELDRERYSYAQAHSDFLARATELQTSYANDQDYATLPKRFGEDLAKVRDSAAEAIGLPGLRERFVGSVAPDIAEREGRIARHAQSLEGNAQIAWVENQGDKFIDQATATNDPAAHQHIIETHSASIEALAARGFVTPETARTMKQGWAHRYAIADGIERGKVDPEGVINDLRAKPGSDEAIVNRIIHAEGTAKNASSSAVGVGQFTDGTWLAIVKQKRPDLASGASDDDILAMRADSKLAREMTLANMADNRSYLQARGVAPTPANLYLAHFLGPKGAAAVAAADPKAPIANVLAEAVGPERAKQMIEANPSILLGRQAGTVQGWADARMGGASAGGVHLYDVLRPDQRALLLQHAEGQLAKQDVDLTAALRQRVVDTTAEAMRTGLAQKPVTQSEFMAALGPKAGPAVATQAFKAYQADLQLGQDVEALKRLDPGETAALIKSYEPVAGEANYAENVKRHASLLTAVQKLNKERSDDPAAYAIARLPASGEAFKTFAGVMTDGSANDETRGAAARDYATKTLMEQARIGIPADQRRVVPQSYIDNLTAQLNDPKSAGGTLNVVSRLQREAQIWGEHWPQVYRQLGAEGGPAVRVIGSGVQPTAARILAELANVKLPDILKDENAEKAATIKKDVLEAFKPLAGSLAGNEGMISVFNDFRGQAEKLAGYYVVRGATSQDAAAQAFKELVGHKYDFVVGRESGLFSGIPSAMSFRMPKAASLTVPQAVAGAKEASAQLGMMDIAPARDTVGGLSADYLKTETVRAYQRDGIWTTAPDESGVMLVYKDQAVRRADGKPLIVPWADLTKLGEQAVRRQENSERRYLELGMPRG